MIANIADVLAKYPTLRGWGFDTGKKAGRDHIDPVAFSVCVEFLSAVERRKTILRWPSSYGWKHIVEEWTGRNQYIGNGDFIAAAIACGFECKRIGMNALFNISKRAVRQPPRIQH